MRIALRALTVVPLAAYACFHVWQHYAALESRDAWLERAHRSAPAGWLAILILVLLLGHFVTCAWLLRERYRARADADSDPWLGPETFFAATLLLFTAYHVRMLGVPTQRAYDVLRASYEVLADTLGRPLPMVAFTVGITALAFHLGTALAGLLEALSGKPRASRYVAGVLGAALWVCYLQVFSRIAIGESLVPTLWPGH